MRAQWIAFGLRGALILLGFPAVFVVLLALGWNGSGAAPLAKKIQAIGITLLWPPAMLAFFYLQWSWVYSRSPYLKSAIRGTVSGEAVEVLATNGISKISWPLFVKMRESRNTLLLYQSPVIYNIIAREFFASEEEWATVKSVARAHVGK